MVEQIIENCVINTGRAESNNTKKNIYFSKLVLLEERVKSFQDF